MEIFDPKLICDCRTEDGLRKLSFATCSAVCSRQIDVVIDNDVISSVKYTGGCNGNLQGIGSLVSGMKVNEVVARLKGINCSCRGTSCPDQLARALELI